VEGLFLSTIFDDDTHCTYFKYLIVTWSRATLDRPLFHSVTLSMPIHFLLPVKKMKKHQMETLLDHTGFLTGSGWSVQFQNLDMLRCKV
jgi:hypothetical protein